MVKKESQGQGPDPGLSRRHADSLHRTLTQTTRRGVALRPRRSYPFAPIKKHPILTGFAFILALLVALALMQSEEKKVKRQFEALSNVVSKESGENVITTARKAQEIAPLFDENCELIIPADSISACLSQEEIVSYVIRGRAQFSDLSLRFVDLSITFPDRETAKVVLTANLKGKVVNGERMNETREVQSTLKKVNRKWLFAGFEVVEVLKK